MGVDIAELKRLRELAGLTQVQAAEKARLPGRQHWNDIESGRRANLTLDVLERVAAAVGAKAKDLLK